MKYYLFSVLSISVFIGAAQVSENADIRIQPDPLKTIYIVEASCGQCNFGMPGKGCELAVRLDGQTYFVTGTDIDHHGDAHAADGFCEAIRTAEIQGEFTENKFNITYFKFIEDKMAESVEMGTNYPDNCTITINGFHMPYGKSEIRITGDQLSIEFDVMPYNSLRKEWHAAQIAATTNKKDLQYFEEGEVSDSNPYYSYTGTGIACEMNQSYTCIYADGSGHHYIYYESDSDKRAELVEKYTDGTVRLNWITDCVILDEKEVKIKDTKIKELYLMVFIDKNLNQSIDKEEYNLVTIIFE